VNRAFLNILTADVATTAQFYQDLLGMHRVGDFGWFVILSHEELPQLEMGVLDRDHATIPKGMATAPAGFIATFVVDDVEQVYARAIAMEVEIIEKPTDLVYGQRRLLLRDPAGAVVDVSAPVR